MISDFKDSLAIILKEEGGNDDDPNDHGGRTSRGIIQREWDAYRSTHPGRPADVWSAPQADIETIYHDQYWEPYCDDMPAGVDLSFFNACVNSGRQQAVKELQRSLRLNSVDGMFGMITKQALTSNDDTTALIHSMAQKRRDFYQALAQFPRYGKGWMARTDRIEQSSLKMLNDHPNVVAEHPEIDPKPDDPTLTVSAKAMPSDPEKTTVSPEASGTVSAGVGGLSGLIQQARDQLAPFSDTIKYVQYALLILAALGIAYTVYGVLKRNRVQASTG